MFEFKLLLNDVLTILFGIAQSNSWNPQKAKYKRPKGLLGHTLGFLYKWET